MRGQHALTFSQAIRKQETIQPDKSKPSSHLVTGVVLRAFAAHPEYRNAVEARHAGELLKTRFFKPDAYADRRDAGYWTKFTYPFWFTDLLSSLDALSKLGFTNEDLNVSEALRWFISRQQEDGLWKLKLLKAGRHSNMIFWVSLAICRVFKRLYKDV